MTAWTPTPWWTPYAAAEDAADAVGAAVGHPAADAAAGQLPAPEGRRIVNIEGPEQQGDEYADIVDELARDIDEEYEEAGNY